MGVDFITIYGIYEIIYSKGSDNYFDALSRREDLEDLIQESILETPVLEKNFDEYDAGSFERDLVDLRESLLKMTHLQCDQQLIKDISNGYSRDPSFNGNSLHARVTFDLNAGL